MFPLSIKGESFSLQKQCFCSLDSKHNWLLKDIQWFEGKRNIIIVDGAFYPWIWHHILVSKFKLHWLVIRGALVLMVLRCFLLVILVESDILNTTKVVSICFEIENWNKWFRNLGANSLDANVAVNATCWYTTKF